jgi:uncharacterized protein (DUF362 family)
MKKLTRRDFLKLSMTGMGALTLGEFLAACGQVNPTLIPTLGGSTNPPVSPQGATPEILLSTPSDTPEPLPDMVVVRGGEPEALVRSALAVLGGMQRFVSAGQSVVVKPNMCTDYNTYEYAATTNPWVVGTLVTMAFESGAASVKVFDFPFGGSAEHAYVKSGIKEQVEAAGGEMVLMSNFKYIDTDLPEAVFMKHAKVFDEILKSDVLINVPIAKHHGEARLTLGMKNLMGLVLDRGYMHNNLGQSIADLNSLIRPQLTLIDAVRILTRNGPAGGDLSFVKKTDTVIASTDIVAADSYAASSLFEVDPLTLAYINAGVSMNLGRADLENLNIREIELSA